METKSTPAPSVYDTQAAEFLARFGFTLTIEHRTPETCPPWHEAANEHRARHGGECRRCGTVHGREYLVTITGDKGRRGRPLAFAYWGSHADRPGQPKGKHYLNEAGPMGNLRNPGCHPSAYDVLACLSGDVSIPETADEVAGEFGPMLPSRAQEIAAAGKRARAFFTASELEALQAIQ